MPDLKDFYAFKNSSGGGGGFGCGWGVIVIVAIMLVFFIFSGNSAEGIETLLSLGILAFLFAKTLFR